MTELMKQFKNRPEGFEEVRKQVFVKTIPLLLIAFIGGVTINHSNNSDTNLISIFLTVVMGLIAGGIGLSIGIKRQKELFESYILIIDTDSITREQKNTPTVKILNTEITEILKNKNGSFTIKGNRSQNIIGVASQIDNCVELERELNEIRSITVKLSKPLYEKLTIPISILVIVLMWAIYNASNKIIVGGCGTLLTGILIWSIFKIQSSKNVDIKTKRGSLWIIVVFLSVIAAVILKLIS